MLIDALMLIRPIYGGIKSAPVGEAGGGVPTERLPPPTSLRHKPKTEPTGQTNACANRSYVNSYSDQEIQPSGL